MRFNEFPEKTISQDINGSAVPGLPSSMTLETKVSTPTANASPLGCPAVAAAITDADATLGRACEPGVRAYETREWWTALHILAPQVERVVRVNGARLNAPILRVTTAQRLMWAQFDPMLEDPVIRATVGIDLARELQSLFTSEYGPNIRNNVAHGAADLHAAEAPAMICLMAILTLADVLAGLPDGGSTEPAADDLWPQVRCCEKPPHVGCRPSRWRLTVYQDRSRERGPTNVTPARSYCSLATGRDLASSNPADAVTSQ